MRQTQTDAEAKLWSRLRNRHLLDLKFRRQRPIGNYFVDFVCVEIRLVVELDGGQHGEEGAMAYDAKRTAVMESLGFTVVRFWDNDVLNDLDSVIEKIWQVASTLTPTLSRKRERE